eukprot:10639147-Karenia_brevis.AAC.1
MEKGFGSQTITRAFTASLLNINNSCEVSVFRTTPAQIATRTSCTHFSQKCFNSQARWGLVRAIV